MNRKYKDTVFVRLFSREPQLRELYNALAGASFGPETPFSVNTLGGVLFMGRRNDISFSVGTRLVVLVEHQSTLNPNMPLRFLFYISRLYEKLADRKAVYRGGSAPVPVPFAEFYVAYNGSEPLPDRSVLRLSDACGAGGRANLELEANVVNINYGRNPGLMGRCETLAMYARFVDMVKRELRPRMGRQELREALQKVINRSIDKGILKEFLEENASEVRNMLYTEWNWDDYMAVKREEAAAEYGEQLTAKDAQIRQYQEERRQYQEQIRLLEEENRRLRG
ncbi:MAG: hypothetical protein LBH15_00060 [Treponema sp.]|jgi:hypothetical protein|nr:hypothetical protein [Treponema sp.]